MFNMLLPLLQMGGSMLGQHLQNQAAERNSRRANAMALANERRARRAAFESARLANEAAANPIRTPAAGMDLEMLREQARKGGFNPLTLLGTVGGAYQNGMVGRAAPVLSSAVLGAPQLGSTLAAGMASVSDMAATLQQELRQDAIMQAQFAQEARMQQQRVEAQASISAAPFGAMIAPDDATVTGPVWIKLPDGSAYPFTADQAERLGLKSGDTMTWGEFEGTAGEMAGLVTSGARIAEQAFTPGSNGGLFGAGVELDAFPPGGALPPPALPPVGAVSDPIVDPMTGVPVWGFN